MQEDKSVNLTSAPLTGREDAQAEFELHCNDEFAASASGPREIAWREIQHYAAQYAQDGPLAIYEVKRRLIYPSTATSI